MYIKSQLPQFTDANALIIVTGAEHAAFYHAADGECTEYGSFHAPEYEPDDRPGHFEQSSHGKTLKAGTAFDPKEAKRELRQRFLNGLPEHIQHITDGETYTHVYVFTPDYMHEEILSALPGNLREKVTHVFYGNFTKHHPNTLLTAIKKQESGVADRVPVHKREVKKILDRFRRRRS